MKAMNETLQGNGTIPCIPGISEDDIRLILNYIRSQIPVDTNSVNSTGGVPVSFEFQSGNFRNINAKVNGRDQALLGPVGIFIGAPSETNPGQGWEVLTTDTINSLRQPNDESQWSIFFARRVDILNNFTSN